MNNKIIYYILSAIIMLVAISKTANAQQFKLKLAHVADVNEPYHKAAEMFCNLVKQNTGGNVQIMIFGNSAGSHVQLTEGLQSGAVDIILSTAAVVTNFMPKAQVLEFPFIFRDRNHVYNVVDGPLAKEIYEEDEKVNMKVIDTWENGFRNITNSVRPIVKPEDIKGMKIRVMESMLYVEMFKALGTTPMPIRKSELYSALQKKIVDAQENPVNQMYSAKIYEVQKYLTLSGHTYSPEIVIFNLTTWKKIPVKYQEVIKKASAEAKKFNRLLSAQKEKEYIAQVKQKGMLVTELSPAQSALFREKMIPVWKMYNKVVGKDLIDKIVKTR